MMRRRDSLRLLGAAPALLSQGPKTPPNIIWITGEDMGPSLNCYGFRHTRTPNLDRLAGEGVRFTRAFTSAPVCSSSRSGFMTGVYQITSGAHHHRSHRKDGYQLPAGIRLVTDRLHDRGYFTCNVLDIAPNVRGTGKTDLNFTAPKPFDGTHWNQREKGQPFFAHINFQAPHKGPAFVEARKQKQLVDPKSLPLPPYWPDHPVVRDEYANFLDAINLLDTQVGATLDVLKKDGLLDNTIIAFFGDNGRCMIRGKQWLYDPGVHVPLIVRWPGNLKPGSKRDDLVSALDLTATTLEWAGVQLGAKDRMDGQSLFSGKPTRGQVFLARDRCDMTLDRIRGVRTVQYKYIRNYMPDRPYTQYNRYIEESYPTLGVMKELHKAGKLNAAQSLFMARQKPKEELYDLETDPHEIHNIIEVAKYRQPLAELRGALDEWLDHADDQGRFPEKAEAQAL
ncbi:MAG: sulfatase [Bryobacterales bacterium]|nr:sulfatase [Bryobacterales bacterium]